MDRVKLAATLAAALAGGVLAACGGDPAVGKLGAHAGGVKLSMGVPAKPGQILTATQMAVTYRDGKGITIQSVEPLGLHGPARYLGTALLLPPRQGFEMSLSHTFPTIGVRAARWARLPYTTTTASGGINLGVGFDLTKPGATSFVGLAVRYRQRGHEYVAVVPLGVRVCVAKHRTGSCAGPPSAQVPEESVRPA
jgi:hypothetical protein